MESRLNSTNIKDSWIIRVLIMVLTMLVFLFSIELMSSAFSHVSKDAANSILQATANPFIGLFIGLLVTALIQSSSTVTSMIIALVAVGSVNFSDAIYMIMGANIGTTLTSTIVSLGYIAKRDEFKRAIAAGTLHDFFNILTVLILFPLEYYYGFISELAMYVTSLFGIGPGTSGSTGNLFRILPFSSLAEWMVNLIDSPILIVLIAFALLFSSIKFFSRVISKILMGESQERLKLFIFDSTSKSFAFGTLFTAAIQSSSVTTSVVVPFAATGKIQLNRIMPFILGSNIGTTITAFIAAIVRSDLVMSIAMTHLIINLIGVIIFMPIPAMRTILMQLANGFGELTSRHRIVGLIYVVFTFFLVPFMLIYANKDAATVQELVYAKESASGHREQKTIPAIIYNNSDLPRYGFDESDTTVIHIYGNDDYVIFGNTIYLINPVGYCWDENENGYQVQFCVDTVYNTFSPSERLTFESVYVYSKRNLSDTTKNLFRYYVAAQRNLMIQEEEIDSSGVVISRESLIEVK